MKKILFSLFALLLVFPSISWTADGDEKAVKQSSAYISLGSPMVLNLTSQKNRLTFLQLQADVLVSDDSVEEIKIHIPAIRHELIVLLSEQPALDMKSPIKREEIRKIATANVQQRIKELTNTEGIGEILFSNFLVQ
ncbi:MAG: flagellar FliL protein [Gammaproteobacteria bacterium]|jgi:flagellar FliL protein